MIEHPKRCALCRTLSESLPFGVTPPGWGRETEDEQGMYYCPQCKQAKEKPPESAA